MARITHLDYSSALFRRADVRIAITQMPDRISISFRQALAHFEAQCAEVASAVGELEVADRSHLARWADDDRAERVWSKIQSLAWGPMGPLDPLDGVILAVLLARRMVESIEMHDVVARRHNQRRARHRERAEQLDALAATWRNTWNVSDPRAAYALNRARMHQKEANAWRALSQKPSPTRKFVGSRMNVGGSRKQKAFMQAIGTFLMDLCGRALDSEVAILNDIAFDTPEATSVFQARSARRPTTREGRRAKNSKLRRRPKYKAITMR